MIIVYLLGGYLTKTLKSGLIKTLADKRKTQETNLFPEVQGNILKKRFSHIL